MAKLPKGPLGLTGVTLGAIQISAAFDKVGFYVSQSNKVELTPEVARQLADWLKFFAKSADESASRITSVK
jgi:hypothetical protein